MTGPGRPSTGTRIDVRVPADVLAEIDYLAKRGEVSRAEVIRDILEQHVEARRQFASDVRDCD